MESTEDVVVRNTLSPPWPTIPSSATSAYSGITANDNSRIHNGNNIYFHQYYKMQSHGNVFEDSAPQATLKRKRSLADIEANLRTREARESLDDALKKLGKLSLSVPHLKEGDGAKKIARRVAAIFDAITTHGDEEPWDKTMARHLEMLGVTVKWEEQLLFRMLNLFPSQYMVSVSQSKLLPFRTCSPSSVTIAQIFHRRQSVHGLPGEI
jgi:hypothetical protein